jgi:TRAP-type C4-dicarboxylate transport system permease small subunit
MVRMRVGVAVTLLTDALPLPARHVAIRVVDGIVLALALALIALCGHWYDPVALVQSGFDFELFAQNTFKFIYSESTNTVGIARFWIWLAVPLMATTMSVHALANLLEGPPAAGDPASSPDRQGSGEFSV